MIRPVTLICAGLAFGSGVYLYRAKHEVEVMDRRIMDLAKQTDMVRGESRSLLDNWIRLGEPERLRKYSDDYLGLKTIQPVQFVRLSDVASKLPRPRPLQDNDRSGAGQKGMDDDEAAPATAAVPSKTPAQSSPAPAGAPASPPSGAAGPPARPGEILQPRWVEATPATGTTTGTTTTWATTPGPVVTGAVTAPAAATVASTPPTTAPGAMIPRATTSATTGAAITATGVSVADPPADTTAKSVKLDAASGPRPHPPQPGVTASPPTYVSRGPAEASGRPPLQEQDGSPTAPRVSTARADPMPARRAEQQPSPVPSVQAQQQTERRDVRPPAGADQLTAARFASPPPPVSPGSQPVARMEADRDPRVPAAVARPETRPVPPIQAQPLQVQPPQRQPAQAQAVTPPPVARPAQPALPPIPLAQTAPRMAQHGSLLGMARGSASLPPPAPTPVIATWQNR